MDVIFILGFETIWYCPLSLSFKFGHDRSSISNTGVWVGAGRVGGWSSQTIQPIWPLGPSVAIN